MLKPYGTCIFTVRIAKDSTCTQRWYPYAQHPRALQRIVLKSWWGWVGAGGGLGRSFCLFKPAVPCFRPPLPSNAVLEALCALTGAMRQDDDDDDERRS